MSHWKILKHTTSDLFSGHSYFTLASERKKGLPENVKEVIEDVDNEILVSKVSLWEIAIKFSIGKLELHTDFKALENLLIKNQFKLLEFDFNDLSTLIQLPFHHQDPFDRLLIAQAKTEI